MPSRTAWASAIKDRMDCHQSLLTFGPKERIGVDYLKKRLRQLNVDPRQIDPDVLLEFVRLALVSAHMSPRRPMKYDATEYKRELEWHADLIRAWVRGEK